MQKIKIFKENSMENLEKKINDYIVGKQVVNISFAMYHKMFEWYGATILYKE